MPFTAAEIENVANATIDFHYKTPEVRSQTLQEKPLLKKMRAMETPFPGGKEMIDVRVKGLYSTTWQGFSHDDEVSYTNPTNIRKAFYPWKLGHAGIEVTMHELANDGISVVDSSNGKNHVQHTQREKTMLAGLMKTSRRPHGGHRPGHESDVLA